MNDKLYTPDVFLFHRFSKQLFLSSTNDLENMSPGIRDKIIKSAYHQILFCTNGIPEIFFMLTLYFTDSVLWASLCFTISYIGYGLGNYYAYQMKNPILMGILGNGWFCLKYVILVILLLVNLHQRYVLVVLILFGILQLWLRIGGTILMLPIRLTIGRLLHNVFLGKNQYYPLEFIGLTFAIQAWRDKLFKDQKRSVLQK